MIRRVLVANRGEIAVRVLRTLREMGIETVAVYTEPDSNAVHRRLASQSRKLETYLDARAIVSLAKETGADAIHPGYGFLSESPSLSFECEQANIVFIGPTTE